MPLVKYCFQVNDTIGSLIQNEVLTYDDILRLKEFVEEYGVHFVSVRQNNIIINNIFQKIHDNIGVYFYMCLCVYTGNVPPTLTILSLVDYLLWVSFYFYDYNKKINKFKRLKWY